MTISPLDDEAERKARHEARAEPAAAPARRKPVRTTRWFIIVGVLLALLVGGIWGFNAFRNHMIAQFFATHKDRKSVV